jgi:ABC-2 type transport system permease protein
MYPTTRRRVTAIVEDLLGPGAAAALLAPVPVTSAELGPVAGRSPGDETAVMVMILVLFFCITVFGAMVLNGVLEEKSSRVVEVLLARIPARTLLAGKITGIGLLGLAEIGLAALAALAAVTTVDAVHLPAIRGAVLAWAVVWFVLGYVLYATVYGALGSLGSRAEDAQSVAAPVMLILPLAYFASFFMIAQPASAARAISYFPLTAPLAMPGRIAIGGAAWWEPVLAAVLTLAATAGLVVLAGRIYTNAILHSGPRLSLHDAWRRRAAPGASAAGADAHASRTLLRRARTAAGGRTTMTGTETDLRSHRLLMTVLIGTGVALGVAVGAFTSDIIAGVIAGVAFIAVATQMVKLWAGHPGRRPPPADTHGQNLTGNPGSSPCPPSADERQRAAGVVCGTNPTETSKHVFSPMSGR